MSAPQQALLIPNLCVGGLIQLVVQVDSQVPVSLDSFHICSINADRRSLGLVHTPDYDCVI